MRLKHGSSCPVQMEPRRVEPLSEGIIPLKADNARKWKMMTDEELLDYTESFIKENGIRNPRGLQKAYPRLDGALRRRGLHERVEFKARVRKYGTDSEILEEVHNLIEEKKILNRMGLVRADFNLYQALRGRHLMDKVLFEKRKRRWGTDEEVLEAARRLIEEKGIERPVELEDADSGLYGVLLNRGLIGNVSFKKKRMRWGTDEEVLAAARKLIVENEMKRSTDLSKTDPRIYATLVRRGLTSRLGYEEGRMKWGSHADVLETAWKLMEEKGILSRKGLRMAAPRLYKALSDKKLLEMAFARIERTNHKEAVEGVLDALDSFGDD